MDNTIIEHLACTEINECILQPPFHLISNVQWNDKGLSFDGDISVYSKEIKKEDFIGFVPIQIKGTTTHKKISKRNKVKHSLSKKDIEVYYKHGKGVLYFVVTINPNTYKRQAYYRILAPLDLKDLLIKLKASGNDSITISFNKLEKGLLESICKQFLRIVEKQPKVYIETNINKKFDEYRIDYANIGEKSFDFFKEPAYLYGVDHGIEIPLQVTKLQEIRGVINENIYVEDEIINIKYETRESEDKIFLIFEDTLIIEFEKETSKGKIVLSPVERIGSYLKCLKVLKFIRDYNKVPLASFEFEATLDYKENYKTLEEDIELYEDIIEIFNNNENISKLFNGLLELFKYKNYEILTNAEKIDLNETPIIPIKLSEYMRVIVFYNKKTNEFIDFFSEETLNNASGLLLKSNKSKGEDIENDYWKVSLYSGIKLEELQEYANFKLDIIKESFTSKHHDVNSENTINVALEYLNYFDRENDGRYLEISDDLISRFLLMNPNDIFAQINKLQINLRKYGKLSEKETDEVLDILEQAEIDKDRSICFACEVLLGNKHKARRLFDSLDDIEQNSLKPFPIYSLFERL